MSGKLAMTGTVVDQERHFPEVIPPESGDTTLPLVVDLDRVLVKTNLG